MISSEQIPQIHADHNNETVLDNFDEWLEVLKTSYPDLGTTERRYFDHVADTNKLGQWRFALTAYGKTLSEIHRKSMKAKADSYTCSRSIHEKLLVALQLCYMFDLEPTNVARKLIQEILSCTGNLHSIFSILSPCHVTREFPSCDIDSFILYPGVNSHDFDEIVLPAFRYYLSGIIPSDLGNSQRRFDLIELLNQPISYETDVTPLMAAVMRKNPSLVELLLRYGADPLIKIESTNHTEKVKQSPMEYIVHYLNGFCSLSKYNKSNRKIFQQALECFYLMGESVTNVRLKVSTSTWNSDQHIKVSSEPKTFYFHPDLLRSISVEEFTCPSSLQKQCRATIRHHLFHSSKKSPRDIFTLPVPYLLKNYLNLNCMNVA